ncbi:hypothetical protein VNO77_22883 [Canavalia gladiata]|uniref:Uncharacterized protein n=1 Tax=Canavalia gladiata TaxID=3824 RepID=A0AAN9L6V2_CANGL
MHDDEILVDISSGVGKQKCSKENYQQQAQDMGKEGPYATYYTKACFNVIMGFRNITSSWVWCNMGLRARTTNSRCKCPLQIPNKRLGGAASSKENYLVRTKHARSCSGGIESTDHSLPQMIKYLLCEQLEELNTPMAEGKLHSNERPQGVLKIL